MGLFHSMGIGKHKHVHSPRSQMVTLVSFQFVEEG